MASFDQNYQIYKRYVRNLALMYQKRQDLRAFTELLLSMAVVVIFGIFAIRPTLVTISELRSQIGSKERTVDQLDTKINALTQAQALYNSNRAAISLIDNAIPTSPHVELYSRQIEGLAQRHSLFIVNLNTKRVPVLGETIETAAPAASATEAQDAFPATSQGVVYEINMSGDYQSIASFLADFENMRRPIFADSLSVRIVQSDLPGELFLSISGRLAYLSGVNPIPNEQQ